MKHLKQKNEEILKPIVQATVPLLVYYLVNQGVVIFLMLVLQRYPQTENIGENALLYLKTAVQMLGMLLAALSVLSFYQKEHIYAKEFHQEKKIAKMGTLSAAGIVITGIITALVINYIFFITGFMEYGDRYSQVAERQFSLPLWLAFLFYGILSPVAEEVVFRGIFYRFLRRNMTEIAAVVGSALMFGAFHGNVVQMLYGTIMGVFMALIYSKFEQILAPILFHSAANTVVYLMSYFF